LIASADDAKHALDHKSAGELGYASHGPVDVTAVLTRLRKPFPNKTFCRLQMQRQRTRRSRIMRAIANHYSRLLSAVALSVALVAPQISVAQQVDEEPSALAMAGDAIIARPLGVVFTAVGAVLYVVTLPFSLAGGNAGEAGKELVVGPAEATFVRCLGCTKSGYKHSAE